MSPDKDGNILITVGEYQLLRPLNLGHYSVFRGSMIS
jgi:hypothetical protein